jgi:hypothetical protein
MNLIALGKDTKSEDAVSRTPWKGHNISNVLNSGEKEQESFETHSVSSMRNCAVFSQVKVPLVASKVHVHLFHSIFQDLERRRRDCKVSPEKKREKIK